jgi:GTP-binding protein
MALKIPRVAIVGRTNVGKSSLFNTIAGRRISIVEDEPGVTRDRNYVLVKRFRIPFILIDTGGLFSEEEDGFEGFVREQTEVAINEADLIVAVFDALNGMHPDDVEVANLLRQSGKDVIWVANKSEKEQSKLAASEFYTLGFDELLLLSAAQNQGIDDLVRKIISTFEAKGYSEDSFPDLEEEDERVRVCILGKPNAGKSSIVNRILGEKRVIESDIAGTTRDEIDIELTRDQKRFVLIDTAGLRKKARIKDVSIERYSVIRSVKALSRSDVAVLVLDATVGPPTEQDAKIASLIQERGRGLVVVVNKWDAVEKDHKTVKAYKDVIKRELNFISFAPILFVSALTGRRCPSILKKVADVYEAGRIRIPTAELNKFLSLAFQQKPPPAHRGEANKLFFSTQIAVSPPTFVLFVTNPRRITPAYERYVKSSLRKEFKFEGNDFKMVFRKRSDRKDQESAN